MNLVPQTQVSRSQVQRLEAHMLEMEQVVIAPKHYFSDGVYAREITIPAGTLLTGEIHKFTQINILSAGEITVLTESGMTTVKAPFTVVSPPGTKRVAYAHTECVWTTILGTELTDLDEIESYFIAKSEDAYVAFKQSLMLEVV